MFKVGAAHARLIRHGEVRLDDQPSAVLVSLPDATGHLVWGEVMEWDDVNCGHLNRSNRIRPRERSHAHNGVAHVASSNQRGVGNGTGQNL